MVQNQPITIIIGTNRSTSLSEKVGIYYGEQLAKKKYPIHYLNLNHLPHDFAFSALYDQQNKNTLFNQQTDCITKGIRFIFIIPEYNGSFPGVLKTFLDGLPFPQSFQNKKAALVGISKGSQGATLALSHFTDILHYVGMHVLPQKVRLPNLKKNDITTITHHETYPGLIDTQIEHFLSF